MQWSTSYCSTGLQIGGGKTVQADDIIYVKGLHKTYDTGKVKVHALKGVDFTVRRGEMVAIIAWGASPLTTHLPAGQAARVYPAEALRCE